MTKAEIVELLYELSKVFLFGGDLKFRFEFAPPESDYLGVCETRNGVAFIEMHRFQYTRVNSEFMPTQYDLTEAAMGRLNTLVHETVHAFLQRYACTGCPSYDRNVEDVEGHGLAWQRVACWIEYAAMDSIGLQLKLGRLEAIQGHWDKFKYWPSPRELMEWSLVDEK